MGGEGEECNTSFYNLSLNSSLFVFVLFFVVVFFLQELVHDHAAMATDYSKELEEWASSDYYDEHVYKIQLPYAQVNL